MEISDIKSSRVGLGEANKARKKKQKVMVKLLHLYSLLKMSFSTSFLLVIYGA